MRLLELYFKDYQVLRDFAIHFEQGAIHDTLGTRYKLDLIVGVNGTGKTTVLRTLALLFQILRRENNAVPPFGFRLHYRLHEGEADQVDVEVSNLDKEKNPLPAPPLSIKTDKDAEAKRESKIDEDLLPDLVVAFTSGSEAGWELTSGTAQEENEEDTLPPDPTDANIERLLRDWYLREVSGTPFETNGEDIAGASDERHFLFIKEHQLPLVILCGLLADMDRAIRAGRAPQEAWQLLGAALHECKIKALRGFSLKFRMNREAMKGDDLDYIARLEELSHHIIQTGSDYLLVFDLQASLAGDHPVQRLMQVVINGLRLFRKLIKLAEPGGDEEPVLREVNLFLERDYDSAEESQEPRGRTASSDHDEERAPLHLLDWLSDGEISFLGRLCLFSLLGESEALILLDEPEVHFNDYWKRQLVHMLDQALQRQSSHVLMTTHSSITLSDVVNKDIWVLQRPHTYTEKATPPGIRTLGADPSDIIVYVFGAPAAAGAQSTGYIQNKITEAAGKADHKQSRAELEKLLTQVGPSMWRFLIRRQIQALEDVQR
jgi:predicted ATPase